MGSDNAKAEPKHTPTKSPTKTDAPTPAPTPAASEPQQASTEPAPAAPTQPPAPPSKPEPQLIYNDDDYSHKLHSIITRGNAIILHIRKEYVDQMCDWVSALGGREFHMIAAGKTVDTRWQDGAADDGTALPPVNFVRYASLDPQRDDTVKASIGFDKQVG